MTTFDVHTRETAGTKSAELLARAEQSYGFIPNLLGVLAESPATLKAYLAIGKIFDESSFTQAEREVIMLTASRVQDCRYCVAAHSAVAGMQKVPADVIEAIRNDLPIANKKLEALRAFTVSIIENRGWIFDEETGAFLEAGYNTFLEAGYNKAQILELILGISFKTISNYANHFANTPLDDAFARRAWAPAAERLAS